MIIWIVKQVIISLVIILLFHQIFSFLTNTLTKPKIIDLAKDSTNTYEEIYATISDKELLPPKSVSTDLPQDMKETMQSELQEYLNELTTKMNSETTPLADTTPLSETTPINHSTNNIEMRIAES
tara:strand:- start:776 stop:1150 length:375 start_codon:yes stop_codon:yes gene_type:complete